MTSKVYKVVLSTAKKLLSAWVGNENPPTPLTREYAIGMKTLPHPGTKLFAFTNLEQARLYAQNTSGYTPIYEAEAENAHPNGWLRGQLEVDEIVAAFASDDMEEPRKDYSSSVVCDSITLLREVQPNEKQNEN